MPKIEQSNIRVFHFKKCGTDEETRHFIEENKPIFLGFLLVFDSLSEDLRAFLEASDLDFIQSKHLRMRVREDKKPESSVVARDSQKMLAADFGGESSRPAAFGAQSMEDSPQNRALTAIIERLIRSGECVESRGDLVILQRVNSGASVESRGNVVILGVCEGDVVCEGEFMILSKIAQGKVRFRGEQIAPSALKYALNLITIEENALKIRDVLGLAGC